MGDSVTSSSFETEAIVEPFTSVSAPESHPVESSSLAKVGYGFFPLYAVRSCSFPVYWNEKPPSLEEWILRIQRNTLDWG